MLRKISSQSDYKFTRTNDDKRIKMQKMKEVRPSLKQRNIKNLEKILFEDKTLVIILSCND